MSTYVTRSEAARVQLRSAVRRQRRKIRRDAARAPGIDCEKDHVGDAEVRRLLQTVERGGIGRIGVVGDRIAAPARELFGKSVPHAFAQGRVIGDGERLAPAFAQREPRDLLCFRFHLQAQHVELGALGRRAVGRIEGERRHSDQIGLCERRDAVARERTDDERRAGQHRLAVRRDDLLSVLGNLIEPHRQRGSAVLFRGRFETLAYRARCHSERIRSRWQQQGDMRKANRLSRVGRRRVSVGRFAGARYRAPV